VKTGNQRRHNLLLFAVRSWQCFIVCLPISGAATSSACLIFVLFCFVFFFTTMRRVRSGGSSPSPTSSRHCGSFSPGNRGHLPQDLLCGRCGPGNRGSISRHYSIPVLPVVVGTLRASTYYFELPCTPQPPSIWSTPLASYSDASKSTTTLGVEM
jgi:hypothetical protein